MKYLYVIMKYDTTWNCLVSYLDEDIANETLEELQSGSEDFSYKIQKIVVEDLEEERTNLKIFLDWIDENWLWAFVIFSGCIFPLAQIIFGKK